MTNTFSPRDLRDTQDLLTDLFTEVSAEEGVLSGGIKLGAGGNALQALRETKVTFGNPSNNLIRLTKKLFDEVKVELTEIRQRQMRDQFDFYYLTLTVSLQPKRGARFTRVECGLQFGPKGAGEPIVQAIFPKSEWKKALSWGAGLNLAINGDLEWGVEASLPDSVKIENLPDHVKANIANKGGLSAFIAAPDFKYELGRDEIVATGEGNSECFWRIEKPDLQKAQTAQFGIVFKVPKGTKSIELTGLVAAEPNMNWLVANLRDVFEDLSDKLQGLLRREDEERRGHERLPVGDHEKWEIALPA